MCQTLRASLALIITATVALAENDAWAQNNGFQLNRFEPTTAGETSFVVDSPWYSKKRYFAAGVTFNYAHQPLTAAFINDMGMETFNLRVVKHLLLTHVDLAASFADRVTLSLSLPFTLADIRDQDGIEQPTGVGVGDPRIGGMVRLWGPTERYKVSLGLGGQLWIPVRAIFANVDELTSEQLPRGVLKASLSGELGNWQWALMLGFLIRGSATYTQMLGSPPQPPGSPSKSISMQVGSELLLGASLYYPLSRGHANLSLGAEALYRPTIAGVPGFSATTNSLDLLAGAHSHFLRYVQVGLGIGTGLLSTPGTADARVILRLAFVPRCNGNGSSVFCPRPGPAPGTRNEPSPGGSGPGGTVTGAGTGSGTVMGARTGPNAGTGLGIGPGPETEPRTVPGIGPGPGTEMGPEAGLGPEAGMGPGVGTGAGMGPGPGTETAPATTPGQGPGSLGPGTGPGLGIGTGSTIGTGSGTGRGPRPGTKTERDPDAPKPFTCIVVVGKEILFNPPLRFSGEQVEVEPKHKHCLQEVARLLKRYPKVKLELKGHTDATIAGPVALEISEKRAKQVRKMLIDYGADTDQITTTALGYTAPKFSNKNPAERPGNNRVELSLDKTINLP